ncbi:helix-turn-helix domain-containing protein [Ignatzschineria sp. RMDPL8A]|uniref:winged helix-turn-helix transcriptional regulator n=1 Tax=Ignatzschineria sp. RMDPL8A TaxID=2999236 RepID=UPI0024466048|nr:helix-turn-helix domain-containing protein [Ignatzschineria sp. RMDPL8A]MDG9730460.1 helix-turn-helix domain-containing protein [Ignatzschineria sp. RMDPL8A]
MSKKNLPDCPVEVTLSLMGSRWKVLIVRELLIDTRRFSELKRALSGISQKVLTEHLRDLEKTGLVDRTVYPEVPPKVEYSLTTLGKSLEPIHQALYDWGTWYRDNLK